MEDKTEDKVKTVETLEAVEGFEVVEEDLRTISGTIVNEEDRTPDPAELRAGSDTDQKKLASAIIAKYNEYGYAHIRTIGPAAAGRAVWACDIARNKLMLAGSEAIQHGFFWVVRLLKTDPKTGLRIIRSGHTIVCEPR